jgi:hypothetical protein
MHRTLIEISENETRKDFSKAEQIDYARRLERIESMKAEKNRLANLKQNPDSLNSDIRGRTDETVARKLGIGGKDTYRKEKYIVDNKDLLAAEDIADWDEEKRSINKASVNYKVVFIPEHFMIVFRNGGAINECGKERRHLYNR